MRPAATLPATGPSDERLMARIQANDPEALGELYDRYASPAFRVSMSVCQDRGRAEDAVQEAFISIWRARASYSGDRGTVAAWLMSVARHRAIDLGRGNARHATRCVSDHHLGGHDSGTDVAVEAAEADTTARLRTLLARLPDSQREVITLAFYGELSHLEIAALLGLPLGTVKGRMRLGLHKLGRCVTQGAD